MNNLFEEIKQYRLIVFVIAYVFLSFFGLSNLAHLAGFCYIILLLEQLANPNTTDTQDKQ
jgi:hypothetical protein